MIQELAKRGCKKWNGIMEKRDKLPISRHQSHKRGNRNDMEPHDLMMIVMMVVLIVEVEIVLVSPNEQSVRLQRGGMKRMATWLMAKNAESIKMKINSCLREAEEST